jgi:prepilin-type processing-associated H-X9-DG protein
LLNKSWRDQVQVACQNNLRVLHAALTDYSQRHGGEFPRVDEEPPTNVAGIYAPLLRDDGALTTTAYLACPSRGQTPTPVRPLTELKGLPPHELARAAEQMGGGYAYSLGYVDRGRLVGLRSDEDHQHLPILADRPQVQGGQWAANSPNHGGRGQNVLFVDGHVQFFTVPTVGVEGDNIFINQQGVVAAGRWRHDSVLGSGAARPIPPE